MLQKHLQIIICDDASTDGTYETIKSLIKAENNIILLHAYRKESQKAPEHEIEKAISEMNDYKRRYGNGQNDF